MSEQLDQLREALSDRYELEGRLGSGGMATVYLARDVKHERQVALKVLRPELSAAIGTERFLNEIRITANLQHPNILPLYDSGEADGLLYYVMPYIPGRSLREYIDQEEAISVDEAIRLAETVASALDYAHRQNVIHRDIKPENILLHDGQPLVADFGIALAVTQGNDDIRITQTGFCLGTPQYMSPEQACADPTIDARSDVYSLGCVTYEMLAGAPPIDAGSVAATIARVVTEPPPAIATSRDTLPEHVAEAVHRALEKTPSGRFATAAQFARALRDPTQATLSAPGWNAAPVESVEKAFLLDETVCRKLARDTLDPRIIGDAMFYLDNLRNSDILVVYLHGLGLDQADFEHTLETIPYRAVAPTAYGFEPRRDQRLSITLDDHVTLLREFVRARLEEFLPDVCLLVGFSAGADVGFHILDPRCDHPLENVDAFLSLDCNLSAETCLVSEALADLANTDMKDLLAALRSLGTRPRTLDEWTKLHGYLVRVLQKFDEDLEPLGAFADSIARPFTEGSRSRFLDWFPAATDNVSVLRCLFSDDDSYSRAISTIKLEHLDTGALGERYNHDAMQVEVGAHHFGLLDQNRLARHVENILTAVREARALATASAS